MKEYWKELYKVMYKSDCSIDGIIVLYGKIYECETIEFEEI